MAVLEWLIGHFDLILILLTVLVNAVLLGYNLVRLLRSGKAEALGKWLRLLEAARGFEEEAEGFANYSAAEKLNYVLSRLRELSAELNYPFEEEKMVAVVERDIAFSKTVNAPRGEGGEPTV